jgi:glycosyltransferase involved in cell wall biosynthesis
MHEAVQHRFLLVTPTGAINPRTGGGQRTALIYHVLRQLGPTEVVIIGQDAGLRRGPPMFAKAEAIHAIPVDGVGALPRSWAMRMLHSLKRFAIPTRLYEPDPKACAALDAIVRDRGITCIVYRYTPALTLTDAAGGARDGLAVIVDIDDREDLRYPTLVAARLGNRVASSGFVRRRAERLRYQLKAALEKSSLVWTVKTSDRIDLDGPVIVADLPNVPAGDPPPEDFPPPSSGASILFVGTVAHRPNHDAVHWFLSKVWPLIAAQDESATVRLVGMGNWSPLEREFGHDQRIEFVGPVDDLSAEYARARLAIAPIFAGAGSQIKLIEACAFGRPVVSSSLSSQGYGDAIADLVAVADTPEAFSSACLRFLNHGHEADRVGAALRTAQKDNFSRDSITARIKTDILSVIAACDDKTCVEHHGP